MKYLPLLLALAAAPAAAAPNDMCVPRALGVPTREGPPSWLQSTSSRTGDTIPPYEGLDDPRWLGATSHTFALGSAKAPLQARALYSTQGAVAPVTKYLYLSFIIDLDGYTSSSSVTGRDLFIGFHRPSGSTGDHGYILQFHLATLGSASASGMQSAAPPSCDDYALCDEDQVASGSAHDYWRVFADRGASATSGCSGTSVNGREYDAVASSGVPWMTTATPTNDAVRYWKYSVGDPSPFLQNRWAVQIRLPIIAASAATARPIGTGIEDGSSFFYEATGRLTAPSNNGPFAKIGWFPPTMTTSVCPVTDSNYVVSEEMSDAGAGCTNCNPAKFSLLSDLGVSTPADCDGGLDIDVDHVGVVFNTPLPADHEMIGPGKPTPLSRQFGARDTTVTNHVVALPVNTTATQIKSHIQGRFRLAEWGSAPWSVAGDLGQWKDIRGAENGVCGTPPPPPAPGEPAQICGETDIDGGKHALLTFDWTIGGNTGPGGIGASEYCEFGLTPPNADEQCSPIKCSCVAPQVCAANTGVQAAKHGGGMWPCVPSFYQFDQCMLVELNSPNGDATFVHQSIWSNMRFGEMSTLTHEALIDARHLPTQPGQRVQDIYFIAVPRNMPQSVPPTSTSIQLAQSAALAVALRIAQPYIDDLNRVPPDQLDRIIKQFHRAAPAARAVEGDDRLRQILRARQIMADDDARRVDGLLAIVGSRGSQDNKPSAALVHSAVAITGSSTSAEIVPTLEIYPYYQPFAKGRAYSPMTSFSLFLSHENTLSGIRYQIDGAEQVGANVYHMQIPVGYARKIQVRAQAITPDEVALPPGMPKWPCAGGCVSCGGAANRNCGLVTMVGNGIPGVIAGVLVVRRRRKKPAKPVPATPAA